MQRSSDPFRLSKEEFMFRAVIFDFDGVITDSEALHLRAFNQATGIAQISEGMFAANA